MKDERTHEQDRILREIRDLKKTVSILSRDIEKSSKEKKRIEDELNSKEMVNFLSMVICLVHHYSSSATKIPPTRLGRKGKGKTTDGERNLRTQAGIIFTSTQNT